MIMSHTFGKHVFVLSCLLICLSLWCPSLEFAQGSLLSLLFLSRAIHIGLETTEETEGVLLLSYLVINASWSSAYDVRVFTKNKAMKARHSAGYIF